MVDETNLLQIYIAQYTLYFNLGAAMLAAGLVFLGITISVISMYNGAFLGTLSLETTMASQSFNLRSSVAISNSLNPIAINSILNYANVLTNSANSLNVTWNKLTKHTQNIQITGFVFSFISIVIGAVFMLISLYKMNNLRNKFI